MVPPPGRLGGTVKLPVQVRRLPEEIAVVDAFAAELSQQSYGAAFSRAVARRIAAMEWLKARQARQAGLSPASPPRAPAAAPAGSQGATALDVQERRPVGDGTPNPRPWGQ